jgi:hypothetical protein
METATLLSAKVNKKWPNREIDAIAPRNRGRFYDELSVGPCLLISRELGAGGSQIAIKVAKRLGWAHLDKNII